MGDEDAYEEEEADLFESPVVIIDNGSGTCKAGLSTKYDIENGSVPAHENPTTVFMQAIGKPRKSWKDSWNKPTENYFCGDEILAHMDKLSILRPIEGGIIEDFEHMHLLWEHMYFNCLQVDDPTQHPVLLTEPPYNPKQNREKMVEIFFESFQVPCLNVSISGVLALQGQGRTTGLVLDSGEGVTYTLPVFDGYALPHCINRLDLAGRELNTLMAKLLSQENIRLTTSVQQHAVRAMKEQLCYVSTDTTREIAEAKSFTLPDGSQLEVRDEQWRCPEALFNPSMVGLESAGVAGLIWDSVQRCEIDLRKKLLATVVLSGGSTMFPHFTERLTKELKNYVPPAAHQDVRVVHSKNQLKYSVWTGAQVLAGLRNLQEDQWMFYDDYNEHGAEYIHKKIAVKVT
mmetsp:Transcript_46677/g.108783  ORF Transcript_46677/g.108783 Transcript_46677/m.108783 type:complete len:402 (-) Transcript_46677:128-1333(-)